MTYRELSVPGAWEITPVQHGDPRGVFLEAFQGGPFAENVGHRFDLQQANLSVSAAGVLRGIHFADVPPGQAKYVTCPKGAVLDIVVDIRVGSPTFGQWDSVLLDDVDRRAIYLSEGLGHAFFALEDGSTVMYLCSTGYSPGREHGIHPLDPTIGIEWPTTDRHGNPVTPQLSEKDTAAPTLAEAAEQGLLPRYDEVRSYLESLRG
ncbi:dTDP-4-dehydrorhamnose 3,5-epimerase family protein [Cellulomonas denverensis]|uniref:dTDP-4-keto-6-deoxy-D-glucose epimerase n=1 Tax=Cellulomonas denverensis TaxID=264297 RepID=A0A7X6KV24_9CELL|nr:dTDP-4-dehydrorhamnose 3,5-epimerase [Cellulomonas denverensis]NKY22528.1 dTDP-4-keto-6-deoxy-D-glucose epimerase [Cellulomonas denverensis]GIG24828.1 DTDP-4-dehydrorhamnose 3,5-epimerase RmlC [Cellulomonas denverensis]